MFKGLGHTHKDKECVKVHFEIIVKTAENIPTTGNVYVQWKRGGKNENKGESKHVPVKDKKAVFEEVLEIQSTLYKIPKKGYESKNISITLKEEKGKKGNSIAKTVIDLAEFAGKDEKRSFSLKSKKSKVAPTLTLHFKSKERALAPDEEVTETDGVTEEAVSDDEDETEEFTEDLKDDSSAKSGRSNSSASKHTPDKHGSSTPDKPRDVRRDSVQNIGTLDVEQLRTELEKAKKRTKELATENVDYEDKVKALTKELEDAKKTKASPGLSSDKEAEFRKKITDLTKESADKDDQIKKLKKEQEDAKQSASNSSVPNEKEAQMKKRLKELATENVDLEEQVTNLKKELDDVRSQGGKRGDKDDGGQRQVQELTDSIAEKDNIILAQKQELENLKKSNSDTIKERDNTILSQKQELENLKKSNADATKEKDNIIASQKQDIASQKQELEILRKSGGDAKLADKELNDRLKEKDSTIFSLKQELAKLTQSNNDALKERDSTILSLKQEVQDLKKNSENKELNDSTKEKDSTILSQKQELEKLAKSNDERYSTILSLKQEVQDLKKSNENKVIHFFSFGSLGQITSLILNSIFLGLGTK
eukprot:Phypoly_transcript_01074.p1 GENE.Phypoly_transcript_01074~~Phypoly_transcript_01074.p1  ORF type:complete len:596 (+),score=155.34 Phypoly_transcript_01074:42-1829(+)